MEEQVSPDTPSFAQSAFFVQETVVFWSQWPAACAAEVPASVADTMIATIKSFFISRIFPKN